MKDEINDLAAQVDSYIAMRSSTGWKNLQAEIDLHVAGLYEFLKVADLDKIRALQGEIAGFEWIQNHFKEVADELADRLAKAKEDKAETTE